MILTRFIEYNHKKNNSYILFNGDQIIINEDNNSFKFDPDSLYLSNDHKDYRVGIGINDDEYLYAVQLQDIGSKNISNLNTQQIDLRYMLPQLSSNDFNLVSRAKQILHWFTSNKFCSSCGSKNTFNTDEDSLYCSCKGINTYPTISPCIITLVVNGPKILLARNKMFPPGMYSALAGFIEAGETAEEALIREVYEEVNLKVNNIRYYSSQSWPFPSQLMLGFYCDCADGKPIPDGIEIEEADWFDVNNLPNVPPPTSIAGMLINSYIEDR